MQQPCTATPDDPDLGFISYQWNAPVLHPSRGHEQYIVPVLLSTRLTRPGVLQQLRRVCRQESSEKLDGRPVAKRARRGAHHEPIHIPRMAERRGLRGAGGPRGTGARRAPKRRPGRCIAPNRRGFPPSLPGGRRGGRRGPRAGLIRRRAAGLIRRRAGELGLLREVDLAELGAAQHAQHGVLEAHGGRCPCRPGAPNQALGQRAARSKWVLG